MLLGARKEYKNEITFKNNRITNILYTHKPRSNIRLGVVGEHMIGWTKSNRLSKKEFCGAYMDRGKSVKHTSPALIEKLIISSADLI